MFIILFLAILAVLILVHEFGHFIVAKRLGIRVDEFGLGFPPRLFGVKRGETTYSINWIPFGGFVKIFGEDPDETSISGPDAARSFVNKPRLAQAAVLVAGIAFNLLFAWALLSVGYMSGMPAALGSETVGTVTNVEVAITAVEPGTPAATAGFLPGDRIETLEAEGKVITAESIEAVQEFIVQVGAAPITIGLVRDGKTEEVTVTPREGIVPDRLAIGIAMDAIGVVRLPVHLALYHGALTTGDLFVQTIVGFGTLLSDTFRGQADLSQISGPVGIAVFVGDAAAFGFIYLVRFVAFISINLAVINLLPFPALDGGRLLFVLIEAIKRSPIKPTVANTVNAIGFIILLGLMLFVTYGDIVRLL